MVYVLLIACIKRDIAQKRAIYGMMCLAQSSIVFNSNVMVHLVVTLGSNLED
jgi:hypothetical protein